MGVYRWFYNRTIDYCEANKIYSFVKVKAALRNKETRKFDLPEWCDFECCPRIISGAIQDCCKAYKTSFSLLQKKKIEKFEMHYKTKKNPVQTLYLEKTCFARGNRILPKYGVGKLKIQSRRKTSKINFEDLVINHDVRLQLTSAGEWNLFIPVDATARENQARSAKIGVDPGVRTFVTGYTSDGKIIEVGKGAYRRIFKLLKEEDVIRSFRDCATSKKRKRSLSKALLRKGRKIRNLIDELHWKTALILSSYRVVYCGDIKVSSMLKRLSTYPKTKRLLCSFRFYDFKQRLSEKCSGLKFVDEAWSSKTCTKCTGINYSLGSNETFNCGQCGLSIGRDINAARNILLKGKIMGATPL